MAIVKLSRGKYAGLSRDIKPRDAEWGASFYEYDTELLYDKAQDHIPNNGWKVRSAALSSESADAVKGSVTVISKDGYKMIVIKSGANLSTFQQNDIVIGQRPNNKFVIGRVKNVSFDTDADLAPLFNGQEFTP